MFQNFVKFSSPCCSVYFSFRWFHCRTSVQKSCALHWSAFFSYIHKICTASPLMFTKTINCTFFVYSNISLFFNNFPVMLWLFLNMEKFRESICSFRLNVSSFQRIARPFWYIIYLSGLRMPKSERMYVTSHICLVVKLDNS